MQVTLKLKYRSRSPAAIKHRRSNASNTVLPRSAVPQMPESIAPNTSVAYVDEERETIAGVKAVNHFFDLRKKLPAPASDLSSRKVEAAPENVETSILQDGVTLGEISTEEVQVQPSSRIIMHTDPRSAGADRFRFLRMCLRELWNAGKLKCLQITSPLPQDGKSTIAMNLATALAEGGKRTVLVIEADLHRPTLSEQLGIEKRVGLAECLEGNINPMSVLRRLEP